MMYAEHTTEELKVLRTWAHFAKDRAEVRRMTLALAERGAFDRDERGPLLKAAADASAPEPIDPRRGERNGRAKLVRVLRETHGR